MRVFIALLFAVAPSTALAQDALLVYRLGKDSLAVEQYTRNATGMSGEMVQRNGAAVVRFTYSITLGKDGRPTAATLTRMLGDGSPQAGAPREVRYSLRPDSAVREVVFADSTQRRAFAASRAMVNFPVFIYGPTELLAALDRKSTRLNSSHANISYAVFCLK